MPASSDATTRPACPPPGTANAESHPARMTAAERLDEVGRILAAGLIRLKRANSTELSLDSGESSLDCPPPQRGHASRRNRSGDAR